MTPCIEHQGYRNPTGYGQVRREGKTWLAHRWAYNQAHGTVPPLLRNKCDNPGCINPDHLEPGTQLDNMRDCVERGRHAQGLDKINAKLTAEQVEYIRKVYVPRSRQHGTRALARLLGVAQDCVSRVVRGISYKEY